MNLPLELAVSAAKATLDRADKAPPMVRLTTDTRTLAPGDTFVALRGERYDGHEFAADAVARGAAMLVVDRADADSGTIPRMLVDDTRRAYMALAASARGLFAGRVIAITGSAGKTTTKAFLAQLLRGKYGNRVLSTPANENNEIGVSKLLLQACNAAYDVIVVEMGARHYGDVAVLVEIARPDFAILTNIGDAHLEIMGSRQRLLETKWGIFSGGARALLNAADDISRRRRAMLAMEPHWFAAAWPNEQEELSTLTVVERDRLTAKHEGTIVERAIEVRVPGVHNRANLAAATAGALELGVPLETLAREISSVELPEGRYETIAVAGNVRLIYDAYNANPSGTMAALDAFAAETASRRIAVLASMAELGEESADLHRRVGAHAAATVDVLLVCGDFARDLAAGALAASTACKIVTIADNAEAATWLRQHLRGGDIVLLKGSRKYRLEAIVEELRR